MELKGKTVLFLGSSVTYGSASGGVSFADMMAGQLGFFCIKEAVSGTTLADLDETSYVARLKRLTLQSSVDLLICQLSTNDASQNIPLEKTEQAIRSILEYTKATFACPVIFYTGTYFKSEAYEAMIRLLYALQAEYDFSILDLFNDPEMGAVSTEEYAR